MSDERISGGRPEPIDLLIIGAGPTGLAIGAAAGRAGLDYLLVERGGLTQAILDFPEFMRFFTTRDLLEIAGVPFTVPDDKPDRRQALTYYRAVATQHAIRTALHEEVVAVERIGSQGAGGEFLVASEKVGARGERIGRRSRAVAFATGYFGNPRRLGVPGEDLPVGLPALPRALPSFWTACGDRRWRELRCRGGPRALSGRGSGDRRGAW